MDALDAVAAARIEREGLREPPAATRGEDERDRPTLHPLFGVAFPLVGADAAAGRRTKRERRTGVAGGAGRGQGDGRPSAESSPSTAPGVPRTGHAGRVSRARRAALLGLPF